MSGIPNTTSFLVSGQKPSAFGGSIQQGGMMMQGDFGGGAGNPNGMMPLAFGNVRPNKNGKEPSISPFFNNITLVEAIDMDLPCKGPNQVLVGMNTRVKHLNTLPAQNGVFPQPQTSARSGIIGLGSTQVDIEGRNMKILPRPNNFDVFKVSPLGMKGAN